MQLQDHGDTVSRVIEQGVMKNETEKYELSVLSDQP